MDETWIDKGGRSDPRQPFQARIMPRQGAEGEPGRWRTVPRGNEPARPGRPFLATVSVALFLYASWVQAERFQECRLDGGGPVACLFAPVF